MNTILVSSTEEGTGKTAIAIALARLAQKKGLDVGYMKPKGTRMESAVGKTRDEDPMFAREHLGLDAEMHELEPIVYSPTFVQEAIRGREDPEALRERIVENFEKLSEGKDLMVIEGGGRLTLGGIVDLTDADIAELLDAETLLVSPYNEPRDVDDIIAAAKVLESKLEGVLFNAVGDVAFDGLKDDAMPYLDGRGIDSVGALPRDEELAGVTVEELADSIGAEILTGDVPTDGLVERFSVGAMKASTSLEQLRRSRNNALITGGNRSEVQTTAMEASGVECIILSGGHRPPSAVLGKAKDRQIPMLLVQSDTRTTIDRVEEALRSGRTRNPAAIERMESLLLDTIDVDGILDLAGEDTATEPEDESDAEE
jgi:BioD-like phosphotransacetylase family protein